MSRLDAELRTRLLHTLVEAPPKFLTPTADATHYLLVGTMINVARILALGLVVGYLCGRRYRGFGLMRYRPDVWVRSYAPEKAVLISPIGVLAHSRKPLCILRVLGSGTYG